MLKMGYTLLYRQAKDKIMDKDELIMKISATVSFLIIVGGFSFGICLNQPAYMLGSMLGIMIFFLTLIWLS